MTALKVMLAASEIPEAKDLRFPLMVSYKIDGVRAPQIGGVAQSRKLIPHENLFVQSWAEKYCNQLHGLDGEFVVGPPYSTGPDDDVFNRSSGPIGKRDGQPDFTFWVFENWAYPAFTAMERYTRLKTWVEHCQTENMPRIQLVEQRVISNIGELSAMMAEALAIGYEGLILKSPRGKYKNGRSTILEGTLMKWKEWDESEAVVLSVNQGTTNTNPDIRDALGHAKRSSAKAGKVPRESIGSWNVRDIYSGVEFKCPPGSQTEAELAAMWQEHQEAGHKDRLLRYKFQKVGSLRKPRFPGMKGWVSWGEISKTAPYLLKGRS